MYPHRQPPDSPRHAVLTTIASDSHTWNLLFLQLLLEEQGWEVTNLGACVPVDVLIEEATARPPGLIVVSTVNGHGAEEAPGLARAVRAVAGVGQGAARRRRQAGHLGHHRPGRPRLAHRQPASTPS